MFYVFSVRVNHEFKSLFWVVLLTVLSLYGCDSGDGIEVVEVDNEERLTDLELVQRQQKKLKNTYYFGFDQRSSPQEDAAQYLPFLKYLENETGYQFKLHFTPKNSSTIDELGMNKSQFAAMGAIGYLKANSLYGARSLVRGLNQLGKAEYQSVLIVRPDSDIRKVKDIKGRRMAFGSENSTQGYLIPRIILKEQGITLESLKNYGYTGSHQLCAEAVVKGQYDICGMQDQLAESLASQGLVKIIHTSHYFPSSGIVANKSVSEEVLQKVKKALLNFKPKGEHSAGLYSWDKTEMPNGFIDANEKDYIELRDWSIKFGFLKLAEEPEKAEQL